jgi:Calx-beta domain
MRYPPTHAAPSDSAPFKQRRPKALRTVLSAGVALAFGLTPAFTLASPAAADSGTLAIDAGATAIEGNDVIFSLHYTGLLGATYLLSTSAGSALPGLDYTSALTPSSVTFVTGGAPQTASVHVKTTNDSVYEDPETFSLIATSTDNPDSTTATGEITDTDKAPTYTISATSPVTEGATAHSNVTATLSTVSGADTDVTLNTDDGTATAADYTPLTDVHVLIPAGQLSSTPSPIAITDDGIKDSADTETFSVDATATPVSLPVSRSVDVSIVDRQSAPKLTLSESASSVPEGSTVTYTVTASGTSDLPMTVSWDAVAAPVTSGTNAATPGDDFPYPSDRSMQIPATETTAEFTITPPVDHLNELPENFAVQLVSPDNATLGTTSKVTTVITDGVADTAPVLDVTPTSVTEGNTGISTKTFTVTLDKKSGRTVTARWFTVDDTAMAGRDYKFASGTLTFPAGTVKQTLTVDIIGDTIYEGDGEDFDIAFTPPLGESTPSFVMESPVEITIADDDTAPTFTFGSVSVVEGDAAAPVLLPIKLSNASNEAITFDVGDAVGHVPAATAIDGEDQPDGDFQLLSDTVTILAGTTTGYAVVLVNGDTTYEPDEIAYLEAEVDSGDVTPPTLQTSTFTIQNDDKVPTFEVNLVTGTVTGSSQDDMVFVFTFAGGSVDGSKPASDNDFVYPEMVLGGVPGGTDTGSIVPIAEVMLNADTTVEPAETILVTGHSVSGGGTAISGVITILDGTTTGPPPNDGVSLSANKNVVDGGGPVTLSGVTTPGATVQPMAKPYGNANLVPYGAPITASGSGSFSFTGNLINSGVVFGARSNSVDSPEVTVSLRGMPTLTGGSLTAGSVTFTVTGMPKISGQTLSVQAQTASGGWTTIGSGPTTAAGTWTHTFTGLKSGTFVVFHAVTNSNSAIALLKGTSASKRVGIR